ncbi:unnamed protein product [Chironomus riparius]|uniref:Uncharacterized protein n=1 Tax=Chironomus riparius TaxID=315576 RepID=A0A9N9RVV6_9DIPT|nr:unnamed protein product [Chironomus riparius]
MSKRDGHDDNYLADNKIQYETKIEELVYLIANHHVQPEQVDANPDDINSLVARLCDVMFPLGYSSDDDVSPDVNDEMINPFLSDNFDDFSDSDKEHDSEATRSANS